MVKLILDRVTLGTAHWAKVHDPAVVEGDYCLEQEVCVVVGHIFVQMHVTNWAEAQKEDLVLTAVLDWLKAQRMDLKAFLAEHTCSKEGKLIIRN